MTLMRSVMSSCTMWMYIPITKRWICSNTSPWLPSCHLLHLLEWVEAGERSCSIHQHPSCETGLNFCCTASSFCVTCDLCSGSESSVCWAAVEPLPACLSESCAGWSFCTSFTLWTLPFSQIFLPPGGLVLTIPPTLVESSLLVGGCKQPQFHAERSQY